MNLSFFILVGIVRLRMIGIISTITSVMIVVHGVI